MEKKFITTYCLNSYHSSITILTLIALPIFDEVGEYTEEENSKVVKLLQAQKVPKFKKTNTIGTYTYKTMEEWQEFVEENNKKIKELLYGTNA